MIQAINKSKFSDCSKHSNCEKRSNGANILFLLPLRVLGSVSTHNLSSTQNRRKETIFGAVEENAVARQEEKSYAIISWTSLSDLWQISIKALKTSIFSNTTVVMIFNETNQLLGHGEYFFGSRNTPFYQELVGSVLVVRVGTRVDEFDVNYPCSTLFDVIYPCFDVARRYLSMLRRSRR